MALTQLQMSSFCHGQKPCRYLKQEYKSNGVVSTCTKLHAAEYEKLKKTREKYGMKESILGDNCKGYIYLLHTPQGYDVK